MIINIPRQAYENVDYDNIDITKLSEAKEAKHIL